MKANLVPATPQETLDSQILRPDSRVSPRIVPTGRIPSAKKRGAEKSHKPRDRVSEYDITFGSFRLEVSEGAFACQDHADSMFVTGFHQLTVFNRAAWLNYC
jgi:hypothetical protein